MKIYTGSSTYLEPQIISYDLFGHATGVKAPDGNLTCDTYDSARGFLSSRRRAMAGQTTCGTTNGADLTTSWARDSALRLTQLTRPDNSCLFYSYDSSGRLYQSKRRDDCSATSSGDYQQWNYTADSQISEIDTYNSSSTLTAKQPYTYFNSRRLQEIVNPANTSDFTGLVYDNAGQVVEVDGAASLSKTTFTPNADHRVTTENRYTGSSTYDSWSLLYAWLGGQSQVTDGESFATASTRDDSNRLVKINSPDLLDPTVRVYDAAGRVTEIVEALGGGSNQETHTFTFDEANRPLVDDYQGSCTGTGSGSAAPHAEIQRVYDALPSGVSCPMTGGCNNLTGRLAYVDTILMCASAYSSGDGSLDQFTFYSYDDAGRLVEEYITDDTSRVADHQYTYTKNGALSQVTLPSGVVVGWSYGSYGSANNSDNDLVNEVWRGSAATPVIDSVQWAPYGPWMQYNWEATVGGAGLQNSVTRNLAYRITKVYNAQFETGSPQETITIGEDAKGRVTSRVISAYSGVTSSYFLYDMQDRVTCETTDSQTTCPTSGSDVKNSHDDSPPFTSSGSWKDLLRPVPGSSGDLMNTFNTYDGKYGSPTYSNHQVVDVEQGSGSGGFGDTAFQYDARGNRTEDDNTTSLTDDSRVYTYDARRNVVGVTGYFYTGSAWHGYFVQSAFDAQNRRVYKAFTDTTSSTHKTATWFFYYDSASRLTEVRYTPDTSATGTYSLFQLF